ncbi:MAG: Sir2 silent information regulator family NAD-dependent deacetylase [Roseburia sp.]|nr:Sir2 silent information regulator family NAD-dependent deacetylase [Roseburia sp.]
MFSNRKTTKSTANISNEPHSLHVLSASDPIKRLKEELATAEVVLIGAGAGLSTSAGLTYSGERFYKCFSDFHEKYGITDIYSGGFYPYASLEEYWAWWSRQIYINRYDVCVGKPYIELLELVKGKDYFVLTTNVDHQFQFAGFDKKRLFYTQGDYGLWQCSKACHDKTYDNKETVQKMLLAQGYTIAENDKLLSPPDGHLLMNIPTELIPKCPVCGEPMTMNLRCDDTFVEDAGWDQAAGRYDDFIRRHKDLHILFLELGVGANTPGIIKYPFWQMTAANPRAVYACINYGEAFCPKEIEKQSLCVDVDIGKVLSGCR